MNRRRGYIEYTIDLFANGRLDVGVGTCKLMGHRADNSARIALHRIVPIKENERPETVQFPEALSDSRGDGAFAGPCRTMQPENVLAS